MGLTIISSLIVLVSVYFGFWLNELARTKKDKKEAMKIFTILYDEIRYNSDNNLNKDFSSEYLSVLGEELLKEKMGILLEYYKDDLYDFIDIYRKFININKALSDYNSLTPITPSASPSTTIGLHLPKIEKRKEIKKLRELLKIDMFKFFDRYPFRNRYLCK